MAKAKELNFKEKVLVTVLLALILASLVSALKILDAINFLALFVILLIITLAVLGVILWLYLSKKRAERLKLNQLKAEKEAKERKLKQLYDILGIEIQYNEDGSVKNLYQLLKISPIYVDRIRQLTSYELLGLIPRFNDDLTERPNVFIIKNRVARVAKGIIEAPTFVFKPKEKVASGQTFIVLKKENKPTQPKPGKKKPCAQVFIKVSGGVKVTKIGKASSPQKVSDFKQATVKSSVDNRDLKSSKPTSSSKPAAPQKKESNNKEPDKRETKTKKPKPPKVIHAKDSFINSTNKRKTPARQTKGTLEQNSFMMVFTLKNPEVDFDSNPWFMEKNSEGEMER